MSARIKESLAEIRKSLEKLLNDDTEGERILDELVALAAIPMTPDLIKESKLGKVVLNIREKYDSVNASISNQAKDILIGWKKIIEKQKSSTHDEQTTASHKQNAADNVAKFNVSSSDSASSKFNMKDYISQLPQTRAAIVNIFSNIFKASANPSMSDNIAVGIEEIIHKQHDSSLATKQYNVKAKLLSFNIKKNQILRENIINGHIAYNDLLNMSSAELASQEQKVAREALNLENIDERRLDWLQEHKEEVQLDIGIDPKNTPWDYDNGDDALSEPDTDPPDI